MLTAFLLADGGSQVAEYYDGERLADPASRQTVLLGTILVPYWLRGRCAAYRNGISWDGRSLAVLAHEVGHFVDDETDEVAAWRNAAVLFGADLILADWTEVVRGLESYDLGHHLDALRAEIEDLRVEEYAAG